MPKDESKTTTNKSKREKSNQSESTKSKQTVSKSENTKIKQSETPTMIYAQYAYAESIKPDGSKTQKQLQVINKNGKISGDYIESKNGKIIMSKKITNQKELKSITN